MLHASESDFCITDQHLHIQSATQNLNFWNNSYQVSASSAC